MDRLQMLIDFLTEEAARARRDANRVGSPGSEIRAEYAERAEGFEAVVAVLKNTKRYSEALHRIANPGMNEATWPGKDAAIAKHAINPITEGMVGHNRIFSPP